MDICRVCLCGEPEKEIDQLKTGKRYGSKSYSEILQFCLQIQVSENSQARKLCSKCYRKTISFYKFKSMALINDAYLKSVKVEMCVKEEVDPIGLAVDETDCLENVKSETNSIICLEQEASGKTLNIVKKEHRIRSHNKDCDTKLLATYNQEIHSDDISEIDNSETIDDTIITSPVHMERSDSDLPITKMTRAQSKQMNIHKKPAKQKTAVKTVGPSTLTRNYTYGPGICDQCGASVKNLKLHVMVHIPKHKRQRFPCNKCDKTFISYTSRKVHQNRWHLGKISHCDICNKDFMDMKSHQLIMHNRDKLPFQCGVCQLRFRHQSALDMHITNHTKEKAFQCDHCGKKFRLKLLLSQHVRSVHEQEKNYVCQHCSKAFFKKYHFTNHLRTHTKEKPFKCQLCNKCFTTTSTLKDHQYSHSTVKDYHCKLCTMSFVKAANLRKHMVSHSNEKKFPCRYCGVGFKRSSPRKKHEYEKHEKNMLTNNVPIPTLN